MTSGLNFKCRLQLILTPLNWIAYLKHHYLSIIRDTNMNVLFLYIFYLLFFCCVFAYCFIHFYFRFRSVFCFMGLFTLEKGKSTANNNISFVFHRRKKTNYFNIWTYLIFEIYSTSWRFYTVFLGRTCYSWHIWLQRETASTDWPLFVHCQVVSRLISQ